MIVLAFDASCAVGTVALTDGARPLCAAHTEGARTHSETMLPLAERILAEAGLGIGDVDLFACAEGPGSFTGVRIAVSLVKGLALPADKPCVGVSSLAARAYALRDLDGIVCPVIDARRGNVYNALFEGGKRLCADRLISLQALGAELAGKQVYPVGDAYDAASALLQCATPEQLREPNGYAVAYAALERWQQGGAFSAQALRPEYLRPSQAERERKEREQ